MQKNNDTYYGTTLKDYVFGISAGDGKYDASILRGLKIIRILFIITVLINFIFRLPGGINLLLTLAVLIFHAKNLVSSVILFTQKISIVPIAVLRMLQILLSYFFLKNFVLRSFIFIILADIVYLTYLFMDKANYEYVWEDAVIDDEI